MPKDKNAANCRRKVDAAEENHVISGKVFNYTTDDEKTMQAVFVKHDRSVCNLYIEIRCILLFFIFIWPFYYDAICMVDRLFNKRSNYLLDDRLGSGKINYAGDLQVPTFSYSRLPVKGAAVQL